jgi:Gnt-I system high-affinity gluconate transporter
MGLNLESAASAMEKGIGNILGSLSIILCMGAMLGKLIAESGAAQKITTSLVDAFGKKYIMWAMVLTAFIVGIPLFFDVSFVLMVPLIITVSKRYDIPVVYIGLPMVAALSVTHGFLPPHPAPTGTGKTIQCGSWFNIVVRTCDRDPCCYHCGPNVRPCIEKI